jgi:Conserved protein/domain typically associated with flavoprotein oxygenases, DIM6/NTAB family
MATIPDQERYKALSGYVAKGVAVVSTVHGRWDYATTITDFLSVSYDPPTMLASIYALSRMCEAIEESGRWTLSILEATQSYPADWLGEQGSPLVSLLDSVPHSRREPGAPAIVDGCLAWFELRTTATLAAATHTLFVGEVVEMGQTADHAARPLVRYRSAYLR